MHLSRIAFRRPSPRAARVAPQAGFTLVELVITIAIAAILSTVAAPAMMNIIRNNRIQTEASALVGDMQFARTEAIKRGFNISVCPSSDGASCLTTNTWHAGWIVFSDLGTIGTVDTTKGDAMLRYRPALKSGDTVIAYVGSTSSSPTNNYVTFNREGFASGLGSGTTMFKFNSSNNDVKAKRCVSLDLTGRLTTVSSGAASMLAPC